MFGPSGWGKSTALSLAAGLDHPSAGEVRVYGRSLARLTEPELAGYRAREVAIVFQSGNLWPALSARENVAIGLRLSGRGHGVAAAVDRALDAFGLQGRDYIGPGRSPVASSSGSRSRPRRRVRHRSCSQTSRPGNSTPGASAVLEALRRLRDEFGSSVVVVTHSQASPTRSTA